MNNHLQIKSITYFNKQYRVYIKNQKEHHKHVSFQDELRRLLKEQGIEVNEKYFPLGCDSTPPGLLARSLSYP